VDVAGSSGHPTRQIQADAHPNDWANPATPI